MRFKIILFRKPIAKAVLRVFAIGLLISGSSAYVGADDLVQLKVKPNKCIALRKGQVCFQKVKFITNFQQEGEFCLYQKDVSEPLACWQNTLAKPFVYEFESQETRVYYLLDTQSKRVLGETKITVAWVYDSAKKPTSGWRLF